MKQIWCPVISAIMGGALSIMFSGCGSGSSCSSSLEERSPGNLGPAVNSPANDFATVVLPQGELLFTSDRHQDDEGFPVERVFRSTRVQGIWERAEELGSTSSDRMNEGTPAPRGEEHEVIFARSHDERKGGCGGADLFSARVESLTIVAEKNLGPRVNSSAWDAQPAVTPEGTLLVFASDRQGGRGGTDLWESRKEKNGEWGKAFPLPSPINSPGNEYSPSLTTYQRWICLVFASDGQPDGLGGLDLYYSLSEDGVTWTAPTNLSTVSSLFNSPADDAFPSFARARDTLYFASTREGGCGGFDLYAAPFALPSRRLEGTVRDSTTMKPLAFPSTVEIRSAEGGERRYTIAADAPGSTYSAAIPPGEYDLVASATECYPGTHTFVTIPPEGTTRKDLYLIPRPHEIVARIDLRSATIPFFVTGYYRLNTPDNLTRLRELLQGRLKGVRYIVTEEANSRQYDRYAAIVEQLFQDSIQMPMLREVFPKFRPGQGDYLQISITGYADPRDIAPGSLYVEDDVEFDRPSGQKAIIARNSPMNNLVLSQLRGYYAMRYIDSILATGSSSYKEYRRTNTIRYVVEGAGVDRAEIQYPARRRVRVEVTLKSGTP